MLKVFKEKVYLKVGRCYCFDKEDKVGQQKGNVMP